MIWQLVFGADVEEFKCMIHPDVTIYTQQNSSTTVGGYGGGGAGYVGTWGVDGCRCAYVCVFKCCTNMIMEV